MTRKIFNTVGADGRPLTLPCAPFELHVGGKYYNLMVVPVGLTCERCVINCTSDRIVYRTPKRVIEAYSGDIVAATLAEFETMRESRGERYVVKLVEGQV